MKKNIVTLFEVRANKEGNFCVPSKILNTCDDVIVNNTVAIYAFLENEVPANEDYYTTLSQNVVEAIADFMVYGKKDIKVRDLGLHGNTRVLDYMGTIVKYIHVDKDVVREMETGLDADGDCDCTTCIAQDVCPNYHDEEFENDDDEDLEDEMDDEEDCGYRGDGANDGHETSRFKSKNEEDNDLKAMQEIEKKVEQVIEALEIGRDLSKNYEKILEEETATPLTIIATKIKKDIVDKQLSDLEKELDRLKHEATKIMINKFGDSPLMTIISEITKEFVEGIDEEILDDLNSRLGEEDDEDEVDYDSEINKVKGQIEKEISDAREAKEKKNQLKKLIEDANEYINYPKTIAGIHNYENIQEDCENAIRRLKDILHSLEKKKAEQQRKYRNENHRGYVNNGKPSLLDLVFGKDRY